MDDGALPADEVARCHGVAVPASAFLTPRRIERINAARYEGEEIAGALGVVRDGDRVLELGAGIGLVGAIIAANRAVTVRSYEANPALIPVARALYALNGLGHRIAVTHSLVIAGPDRPATMSFQVHNSYLGSSLVLDPARAARTVEVATVAWDALMADFAPDVLVMDIEGGEAALLAHADLSGLRAIVLELHPKVYGDEGMRAARRTLRQAGFARIDGLSSRTVWSVERPA